MEGKLTDKLNELVKKVEAESNIPVKLQTYAGELTFIVEQESLFGFLQYLRKEGFDYLVDVVSVDHYTDDDFRFEIHYNIYNLSSNIRIRVKSLCGLV